MDKTAIINEINAAVGAHGAWKLKLRTAISQGSSTVTPDVACRDDQCAFGKWLHSPSLDSGIRAGQPYTVIKRLHADFHKCASTVLSKAVSGQSKDAAALLEGEFKERSQTLVLALSKWKGELQAF